MVGGEALPLPAFIPQPIDGTQFASPGASSAPRASAGMLRCEWGSMKCWLDTEFIARPFTIDLISIGLVAENGREFHREQRDVLSGRRFKRV